MLLFKGYIRRDDPKALADDQTQSDSVRIIRIDLHDKFYELPYDFAGNRIQVGQKWYYADDQTLLLMYALLSPDSGLAAIDALLEKARVEFEQNSNVTDTLGDDEKLKVGGKDFIGWKKALAEAETVQQTTYYDSSLKEAKAMTVFKDGIAASDRLIVFT